MVGWWGDGDEWQRDDVATPTSPTHNHTCTPHPAPCTPAPCTPPHTHARTRNTCVGIVDDSELESRLKSELIWSSCPSWVGITDETERVGTKAEAGAQLVESAELGRDGRRERVRMEVEVGAQLVELAELVGWGGGVWGGDVATWRRGDVATWRRGDVATWRALGWRRGDTHT